MTAQWTVAVEQGRGFERGVVSGHLHPALPRGVVLLVGSSTGGVTCLEALSVQEPRLVGNYQLGFSSQVPSPCMVRFQGQKLRTGLGMRADEGVTGLQTPPSGAARVMGFRLRFRSPVEVLFEQQIFLCMDDVACCECARVFATACLQAPAGLASCLARSGGKIARC